MTDDEKLTIIRYLVSHWSSNEPDHKQSELFGDADDLAEYTPGQIWHMNATMMMTLTKIWEVLNEDE